MSLSRFAAALLACTAAGNSVAQETKPSDSPASAPASRPGETDTRPASRPDDPLRRAAAMIGEHINGGAPILEEYGREFLLAFPPSDLRALYVDYKYKHGTVTRVEELRRPGPKNGVYRLVFERKVGMRMELAVDGDPPRISGLLFSEALPEDDSRFKALSALTLYYGKTGVATCAIPDEGPIALVDGHAHDARYAIAGVFKLYIFGALIEEIAEGRRRWDEVVRLDPKLKAPPAGRLQNWSDDAPVTVHTLATLMITDSDDTAADHLLAVLGREKVEAMLPKMGMADPTPTLPVLSARDLFVLKYEPERTLADRWLKADAAGRRAMLPEVASRTRVDLAYAQTPRYADTIEWFATPRDVCEALAWIKRNTESGPAAEARAILGLHRGLPIDATYFPFAGFKGGSEPGVSCVAWLLRKPNGKWFAFCAAWNEPGAALEERRFMLWVQRYLELCAVDL
jgi:hypothetical protein